MMTLQTKKNFSKIISELIGIEKECSIDTTRHENLLYAINTMPLLVPVVGEFSAGKSSLLNKCMERKILSVDIAPETAKPAELYYSENEYDESVNEAGETSRITDISNLPENCMYVRRYIKSDFLEKIQPIVLVDMPGFDSPVGDHNKSIFNYLDKGSHYIVLTPVDAGTISRSMINQIQNIITFEKDCTFFISKTDLRSEEEVAQVQHELEGTLESIVGEQVKVSKISQEDVSMFDTFATSLNPDSLFKKQFFESVKDACLDTKASLNTKIAALKSDKAKNIQAIEDLKDAQKKIEEKKNRLIENARNNGFIEESEAVAGAVGRELSSNLDNLASLARSGGKEAVREEINSIVQTTVVSNLKGTLKNLTGNLSASFAKDLGSIGETFADYFSPDLLDKIQNAAQNIYDSGKQAVDNYINERKNKTDASTAYTALTGVLAAATEIFAPVVEVIIILLPQILNMIFGKIKEKNEIEQIKQNIAAQIPSIKRSVREKVVQVLKENSESMISAISAKYDEELRQKAAEIESAITDKMNRENTDALITSYQAAVKNTEDLLNSIL